jgi:hypothetical protein
MILTGEYRINGRKACPGATFSVTNPTWSDFGWNADSTSQRTKSSFITNITAYENLKATNTCILPIGSKTFECLNRRYIQLPVCFKPLNVTSKLDCKLRKAKYLSGIYGSWLLQLYTGDRVARATAFHAVATKTCGC